MAELHGQSVKFRIDKQKCGAGLSLGTPMMNPPCGEPRVSRRPDFLNYHAEHAFLGLVKAERFA